MYEGKLRNKTFETVAVGSSTVREMSDVERGNMATGTNYGETIGSYKSQRHWMC